MNSVPNIEKYTAFYDDIFRSERVDFPHLKTSGEVERVDFPHLETSGEVERVDFPHLKTSGEVEGRQVYNKDNNISLVN